MVTRILICFFLLVGLTRADSVKVIGPPDPKNNGPRLYDLVTQFPLPATKDPLLAHRLYMVYVPEEDSQWYFVLTDGNGDIAKPLQLLRGGTVIPGSYMGGSADKHYLLNRQRIWIQTFNPEQHFYWTLTKPPIIEIVGFKALPVTQNGKKEKGA